MRLALKRRQFGWGATSLGTELLSEHGKRRAELGRGDDCKQAYQAYDKACRKYPHNGVRLRQGNQIIAYRIAGRFVHAPNDSKH